MTKISSLGLIAAEIKQIEAEMVRVGGKEYAAVVQKLYLKGGPGGGLKLWFL